MDLMIVTIRGSCELKWKSRNKQNGQRVKHGWGWGCPASRVCDHRGHWRHKLPMRRWGQLASCQIARHPKFGAGLRAGIQCSALRIWPTEQVKRELWAKKRWVICLSNGQQLNSRIACCGILIVVLSITRTGWTNVVGSNELQTAWTARKGPGCWTYHLLELYVYPE